MNRREFLLGTGSLTAATLFGKPVRGLVGQEGLEFAGPGNPTARDYVRNGLIRMWDGIENVGPGLPHAPDSPSWVDHVTGLVAAVQADAYWSDTALCRDSKAAGSLSMAQIGDAYSYDYWHFKTVEAVCEITQGGFVFSDTSYKDSSIYSGHTYLWASGTSRLALGHYSAKTVLIRKAPATYAFSQDTVNGEMVTVGASVNGLEEDVGKFNDYFSGPGIRIGGGASANRAMLGRIYALRFYDRVLGVDELAHNYEVDKARFGL